MIPLVFLLHYSTIINLNTTWAERLRSPLRHAANPSGDEKLFCASLLSLLNSWLNQSIAYHYAGPVKYKQNLTYPLLYLIPAALLIGSTRGEGPTFKWIPREDDFGVVSQ